MEGVKSGAAVSGSARHGSARRGPAGWRRPRTLAALSVLSAFTAALLVGAAPPESGAGRGPDTSGETVSLTGSGPGERLNVTLTRVSDPVDPAGPALGGADRLVSVELRLKNTGTAVYEDSPAAATHLLDSGGHRFAGLDASTEAGAHGAAAFPGTLTLDPGSAAAGSVVFRLPKGAGLAAVQFALEGGLGDDVAQWSLP
ncbi:hypothetical protein ACIA8F_16315 [Streptomyces sp. NPDC051563]|uniref:hypothetical protein n=1 Tax=Streptomyces sp. NPDC051563 TaxID=3365659 RepID=UPI00378757C4